MSPTRRALLSATPLLAVAACAGQTAAQVSAQIVADLNNAIAALSNAVPAIAKADPSLLSVSVQTQIQTYAADARGVLTSVSTTMAATSAAPALSKAEADLNAILAALAAVPLIPPPYSMIIAAAAMVAPMVEGYIATLTGPSPATAPKAATAPTMLAARYGSGMTLSQAEQQLAAAAKGQM